MIRCGRARAIVLDAVRGGASEADRLALDGHLNDCAQCRAERARLNLLASLRDHDGVGLGSDAHARILKTLTNRPAPAPAVERRVVPRAPWFLVAASFALVLVVATVVLLRGPASTTPDSVPVSLADGTRLLLEGAGTLSFAGSQVTYVRGTELVVSASSRTLELVGGEVDVDVTPGGPGRYRVVTSRFIVEVLGTRFVVGSDRVQTVRGLVRVLDLQENPLALLHAGESWSWPPPPVAPATLVAPVPALVRPRPAGVPARHAAPASADELLAHARGLLSKGDVTRARTTLARLDRLALTDRQRAERALLSADGLRLEGRRDEALEAYRRLAVDWQDLEAGESGAFLLGEVLVESGRSEEARVALEAYLARYPRGRFAEEVRGLLERRE